MLADGAYRVLLKASRVFGNIRDTMDTETRMSPVIIKNSAKVFVTQPLDTKEVLTNTFRFNTILAFHLRMVSRPGFNGNRMI